VDQLAHNEHVENAWQSTMSSTAAAAEKTVEMTGKIADELTPAVEAVRSCI
jgi:hypothetical protein